MPKTAVKAVRASRGIGNLARCAFRACAAVLCALARCSLNISVVVLLSALGRISVACLGSFVLCFLPLQTVLRQQSGSFENLICTAALVDCFFEKGKTRASEQRSAARDATQKPCCRAKRRNAQLFLLRVHAAAHSLLLVVEQRFRSARVLHRHSHRTARYVNCARQPAKSTGYEVRCQILYDCLSPAPQLWCQQQL